MSRSRVFFPVVFALLLVELCQAQHNYVPTTFQCTRTISTSTYPVYSTPPPRGTRTLYVDLIHIMCGEVNARNGKAHGFHARPGNVDPASASTTHAYLLDPPANTSDTSMYSNPRIYTSPATYVVKTGVSSVWPTAMTMEQIVKGITVLDEKCK